MPDTLKQIYSGTINVTGLTGDQTATLFTNNATTRVVIKDVDVTNTFPVQPNLTVGGTGVAAIVGSLTGSEIVDVSQAVGISFPQPLSYSVSGIQYAASDAGFTSRTVSNSNLINKVSVKSTTQVVENAGTRAENFHGYYYVAADSDVFFILSSGTTSFRLAKRAGGPQGTATDIVSGSNPIAFDGRYYYYFTSSNNLRRFDPETETVTNTTISGLPNGVGSGARLIHSNGYLMYLASDGQQPLFLKISNGYWVQTSVSGIYSGNMFSNIGFFIDPSTLVITLFYFDGSNVAYRVVSNSGVSFANPSQNLSGSAFTTVTKTNGTWSGSASGVNVPMVTLTSATTGLMNFGSGGTYSFDCSGANTGWSNSGPINTTTYVYYMHSYTNPIVTNINTTDFPSTISLRITGVEVTP